MLVVLSVVILTAYTKSWWRALLLILCHPVLECLLLGQIDCLLVLAFILPPHLGIVVAACKPQVMIGWMIHKIARWPWDILPLLLLVLASMVAWPNWPLQISTQDLWWGGNISVSPFLWSLGILLVASDESLALVGGLFFSPFVARYSLTPVLAHFYKQGKWWVLVLATAATWVAAVLPQII